MKSMLEIRNVSKQYELGRDQVVHTANFREVLAQAARAPFRALLGRKAKAITGDKPYLLWALDDVSFDIPEGQVIGIIGRNGAGKSTLLKILSRITAPTEGTVTVRGRLASLLEVGTGFHPELTGRENIFLNGAILGMRKAEITRRFDEIVAFAEIEKFLDTPVKHYSSGMFVRLAFAVAAHLDPEILIVDEVLAVGDLSFQKKCLGKMGEVSRGGRTVLFVSHNLVAVENLCARGVVLTHGKKVFDGSSKDAIQYYLKTFSTHSGTGHIIDLDRVGERRSILAPLLKRMDFFADDEQPITAGVPVGSRLKIKVHFELPTPIDDFNVGLGFNNNYGQRVFTAHSIFEPNRWESEQVGAQTISCEIPTFTLMPGEYAVSVWLDLKGRQADSVADAATIRVLESNFYGSGRGPWQGPMWPGVFVLPHRWYLEQEATADNYLEVGNAECQPRTR